MNSGNRGFVTGGGFGLENIYKALGIVEERDD